jgi:hypothetical protein
MRSRAIIGPLSIIPIAAFALACALAQLVWLAQKTYYAPDYDRLVSQINSLVTHYATENRHIALDAPIATAIDDVNVLENAHIILFGDPAKDSNDVPGADVLLRAQTELGSLPEPNSNFALVEDHFHSGSFARVLKPESLYFAVYEARSNSTSNEKSLAASSR